MVLLKYIISFLAEFKKSPTFEMKDVSRFLRYHGSTGAYAKIFISHMVKGGKVHKLTKGFYTVYGNIETVGFPFYPFYYGLGFALTCHKLWKQQANPYVLTVRNVRRGSRKALGLNYNVSKISKGMFFGYYYVKGKDFYYPVSDIEKTLIDCIYYGLNLEDYVYENIFGQLDNGKMQSYLKRCNDRTKARYFELKASYWHAGKLS